VRTDADDPPTRAQTPASAQTPATYPREHDLPAESESQARFAERERQEAHAERRRALNALDAADVLWRLIRIAVYTISAIIALAIVFHLLNANHNNSFVSTIEQWGKSLAGPFAGMFLLHSAKATIGLDYGIAIIVYIVVAELVINLIGAAIVPARRRAATPADGRFPPPPQYPQYQ
jgi:hypothetical protein